MAAMAAALWNPDSRHSAAAIKYNQHVGIRRVKGKMEFLY
jgi:hypothetical protein